MHSILSHCVPLLLPLLGGTPDGLPSPDLDRISAVVEERTYDVLWQAGLPIVGQGAGWQAPNRAQGLRTVFGPEGVQVVPREGRGWTLALTLSHLERGGVREGVAPARLEVRGSRVEYQREGLVEWYSNEHGGLHQAFELQARPLAAGDGPLSLVLEIGGSFDGTLLGPRAVRFAQRDGEGALTWSGLAAWDSLGTPLDVCVSLETGVLAIVVDDTRAVYPLTIDPVITNELQKVVASDAAQGATLGEAIAIDGNTFVVGTIRDASQGLFTGAAYVFHWNGSSWVQQAKLVGSNAVSGDTFGQKVGISGERIVVGSDGDGQIGQLAGQVYVYRRESGVWIEEAILQAADGQNMDTFGRAVAIHGDTLVVGARGVNAAQGGEGAVYVFTRSGTNWIQQVKLFAGDLPANALFGHSVDVHAGTLVAGAYLANGAQGFEGAAYVFTGAGQAWAQEKKLVASDAALGDQFGWDVAVHGETVVVGARFQDPLGSNSGAVYVFERQGGNWPQVQKVLPSDGAAFDRFGHDVDIEGDSLVVGALEHDALGANAGAAYVFQRIQGVWVEVSKLQPSNGAAGHTFGYSVGTSNNWSVVGSPGESSAAPTAGAAYIFQNSAGVPYCFGNSGNCPCGNNSGPGEGCVNSTGQGARLITAGSSSVAGNNLTLNGTSLRPGQPALAFSANNAVNGGLGTTFGDGLRCAGGAIRRLGVKTPNAQGSVTFGPGLGAAGGWSAGDTRRMQLWYRDPVIGPCGSGFNLSNGVEVLFVP